MSTSGVVFDDRNILGYAGLVPLRHLADSAELAALADQTLSVPTDKGANAGAKVASLVMGMAAGADSIDDMALLRHGATPRMFAKTYAPSTLGSFLRAFTFGHVRQLDAVASRFLAGLAQISGLTAGIDRGRVFVDLDPSKESSHQSESWIVGGGVCGERSARAATA